MHAFIEHGVKAFDVKHDEITRDYGVVGHACGVNGCTYDGNHEGRHSWETVEGIEENSTPPQGIPVETEGDHE